jgi:hypothetical protein
MQPARIPPPGDAVISEYIPSDQQYADHLPEPLTWQDLIDNALTSHPGAPLNLQIDSG